MPNLKLTRNEKTDIRAMLAREEILRAHNLPAAKKALEELSKFALRIVESRGLDPTRYAIDLPTGKIIVRMECYE